MHSASKNGPVAVKKFADALIKAKPSSKPPSTNHRKKSRRPRGFATMTEKKVVVAGFFKRLVMIADRVFGSLMPKPYVLVFGIARGQVVTTAKIPDRLIGLDIEEPQVHVRNGYVRIARVDDQ